MFFLKKISFPGFVYRGQEGAALPLLLIFKKLKSLFFIVREYGEPSNINALIYIGEIQQRSLHE
jgi:hypothetical protein